MNQSNRKICLALAALSAAGLSARAAFAQSDTTSTGQYMPSAELEHRRPLLMVGMDMGISAMNEHGPFGFDDGVGTVTRPGPAWGARVGVELFRWLAVEARYVGMYNSLRPSVNPDGSLGYVTTGGEAVVRLTLPLPFVHPYVFGGVGYYDVALAGSSSAQSGTVMNSSAQPGVPMGFGVDVPITWHLSVGAEATYHFLIGERFSSEMTNGIDGGDISTFNGVLRLRL